MVPENLRVAGSVQDAATAGMPSHKTRWEFNGHG